MGIKRLKEYLQDGLIVVVAVVVLVVVFLIKVVVVGETAVVVKLATDVASVVCRGLVRATSSVKAKASKLKYLADLSWATIHESKLDFFPFKTYGGGA